MTCFKRKIFLISSTSNTVCGLWRQTPALPLLNLVWILSLLTSQPYLEQSLAPLIPPDFCFPFQECLAWLCIKDSPSYLAIFFPYLQNIIKGFAGKIEGTVPGGILAVGGSALQYFRLVGQEGELQSWSLLLCQHGFSGLVRHCWLPRQEPCWEHPAASQTWAMAALWTPFIQDTQSILLLYRTPWNLAGNPGFPVL